MPRETGSIWRPLVACPFCKLRGTKAGLPRHVATKHADQKLPDWVKIGPDRWTIDTGSNRQPSADVAPIMDNPQAPPYWWFIQPPIGGRYTTRTIVKSGLAHTVEQAKQDAYADWLPFWSPERRDKGSERNSD